MCLQIYGIFWYKSYQAHTKLHLQTTFLKRKSTLFTKQEQILSTVLRWTLPSKSFKEKKVVKKTEYIIPYQDSGIGNMVNLRVVGVIWAILLLLKIICKDEEWGFFLMFTALLLLFILPFFITKEVFIKETNVDSSSSSTTTLELSSPPTSSYEDELPLQVVEPSEPAAEPSTPSPRSSSNASSTTIFQQWRSNLIYWRSCQASEGEEAKEEQPKQ